MLLGPAAPGCISKDKLVPGEGTRLKAVLTWIGVSGKVVDCHPFCLWFTWTASLAGAEFLGSHFGYLRTASLLCGSDVALLTSLDHDQQCVLWRFLARCEVVRVRDAANDYFLLHKWSEYDVSDRWIGAEKGSWAECEMSYQSMDPNDGDWGRKQPNAWCLGSNSRIGSGAWTSRRSFD